MNFNYRTILFAMLLNPHQSCLFSSVSCVGKHWFWAFWPKHHSGTSGLWLNILSRIFIESTAMAKLEVVGWLTELSLNIIHIARVRRREAAPTTKYHFQSGLSASKLTFMPKRLFTQSVITGVVIWLLNARLMQGQLTDANISGRKIN